MGLDQYVRTDTFTKKGKKVGSNEIWYGRKISEIHNWMQQQSGIAPKEFNCAPLVLTEELLNKLEIDMKHLTSVDGFFFGGSNDAEQVTLAVKELIEVSRAAIKDDDEPYYTSWW